MKTCSKLISNVFCAVKYGRFLLKVFVYTGQNAVVQYLNVHWLTMVKITCTNFLEPTVFSRIKCCIFSSPNVQHIQASSDLFYDKYF